MRHASLILLGLLCTVGFAYPAFAADETAIEKILSDNDGLDEARQTAKPAAEAPVAKPEPAPQAAEQPAEEGTTKVRKPRRKPAAAQKEEAPAPLIVPSEEPARETPKPKRRLSDFIDTKINITLADDNLRENSEFSPAFRVVENPGTSYTARAGDLSPKNINRTNLVVHHYSDGYLAGVLTEAALVLRFDLSTDPSSGALQQSIKDDGTYLRFGYIFDNKGKKETILDFVGFPFNADAFLLGYHYDLSWADAASFPNNKSPVPGFRIGFTHPMVYAFAGLKTHLQPLTDQLNTERVPVETVYAGLFGAGVKPVKGLAIEANGGFIQKGDNPSIPEIKGKTGRDNIWAGGISARISYAQGLKIGDRMDLRLQQTDPRLLLEKAPVDEYQPRTFSYYVSVEQTYLQENLQDPDKPSSTKAFKAPTALVEAKFKYDYFRIYSEFCYRSLQYLLFNTPGLVPYQAFPKGVPTRPEMGFILALDYYFKEAYLTLGGTFGYKRPATYGGGNSKVPLAVIKRPTGSTAYISPFDRSIEIMPGNIKNASDIIEARFDTQFRLSEMMNIMFEVSYVFDENRVKQVSSAKDSSVLVAKLEDPNVTKRVGIAFVLQAYF